MLNLAITKESVQYLEALLANGIVVIGTGGKPEFSPNVKPLVNALHELLAGGQVQLTVKTPGNEALRIGLQQKLDAAMASVSATEEATPFGP